MPERDAATYRFNPFDLTKVWPHADYPLIEVGKVVLDRTPDNYFAETEQAAFDPAHMVPGIGPSPDRMLQARLFAYGDAHRYRLGINHTRVPVNAPKGVEGRAQNYGRDGAMRFDDNGGRGPNYEPNSFDGPAQTGEPLYAGFEVSGVSGTYVPGKHKDDNDFVQASDLYRLMCNEKGDTLVMLAAYHGQAETVRLLAQAGADLERPNDRGQTPLAGAAFKGDAAVTQALLDGGAQVDGADTQGRTPLMYAAMFNRADVLSLLLASGADRTRRAAEGHTAAELARGMGALQAATLLQQ
jgi:catalase